MPIEGDLVEATYRRLIAELLCRGQEDTPELLKDVLVTIYNEIRE